MMLLPDIRVIGGAKGPIMRVAKLVQGLLFISTCGALGVPWAQAQQAAAEQTAETDEPKIEEVVVTGSRIRQSEENFANPVTTFSAESIVSSGKTDLGDFLSQTPALVGSVTGDLTAGSNPGFGEVGLNLLDLRHLGVDRTLVLVDGRRHVAGLAGSAAVDVDSIPTDLLRAVDVLTGGASAIYGAEACRESSISSRDGISRVCRFAARAAFRVRAMATTPLSP